MHPVLFLGVEGSHKGGTCLQYLPRVIDSRKMQFSLLAVNLAELFPIQISIFSQINLN